MLVGDLKKDVDLRNFVLYLDAEGDGFDLINCVLEYGDCQAIRKIIDKYIGSDKYDYD